VKIYFWSLFS